MITSTQILSATYDPIDDNGGCAKRICCLRRNCFFWFGSENWCKNVRVLSFAVIGMISFWAYIRFVLAAENITGIMKYSRRVYWDYIHIYTDRCVFFCWKIQFIGFVFRFWNLTFLPSPDQPTHAHSGANSASSSFCQTIIIACQLGVRINLLHLSHRLSDFPFRDTTKYRSLLNPSVKLKLSGENKF